MHVQDRLFRLFCTVGLAFASLATAVAQPLESPPLELNTAEFVVSGAAQPPSNDLPWQKQTLPDQWQSNHPGVSGDLWYRLSFDFAATETRIHAVYLPRLCMNAAVFLNGFFLGSGGRIEEPVARNWNRPLFFLRSTPSNGAPACRGAASPRGVRVRYRCR